MYNVIQGFIDYSSFKVITKQWLYLPVLHNISLLLIYFLHSSFCHFLNTEHFLTDL